MFRITPEAEAGKPQPLTEVEFAESGLKERYDIQEWIAAAPEILQPDLPARRQPGLLVIAKEFSGFDKVRDRVDLLAVDRSGALVVIELKRDDSGEDVHWQAIKYASYFHRVRAKKIVKMLAEYEDIPQEDARTRLEEHLDEGNLDVLNHRTRIILASHRFAPHVTSAALWLNEQVGRNLFTCVQLIPFRDEDHGALYLQANTIIPVPGAGLWVRTGAAEDDSTHRGPSRQGEYDEVKAFFAKVEELATRGVPDEIRPQKRVRKGKFQWASMWYLRHPWSYDHMFYMVELSSGATRTVRVSFGYDSSTFEQTDIDYLERLRDELVLYEDQEKTVPFGGGPYRGLGVKREVNSLKEERVASETADVLRKFLETITPKIDEHFGNRDGAEGA